MDIAKGYRLMNNKGSYVVPIFLVVAIAMAAALFPRRIYAEVCRIVEYPSHVEVECIGSPAAAPALPPKPLLQHITDTREGPDNSGSLSSVPDNEMLNNGAQVSRTRKQLEAVYVLNSRRLKPAKPQTPAPGHE